MVNVVGQFEAAVLDLRNKIPGRVVAQGDDGYDKARRVWNGAVDHHPTAIVWCQGTEDVQSALRTARAHGLPVSVRGRGHDAAGRSVRPGAVVIDMSRMDHVQIDDDIARVAGGATAAGVIAAAAAKNLMPVTGWNGVPGMVGLATVGGYGPLIASHGLALDSLIGAELVLADGRRLTADSDNNPDLLWALKGGCGNFGVVTSMRVQLYPARRVLGGMMLFQWEEAETVLNHYAEAIGAIGNDLSVVIGFISLPDGRPGLFLAPAWIGEPSGGETVMEALKRCGKPVHVQIGWSSYQDLVQSFDSRVANDRHHALETRWLPALRRDTISALIAGASIRSSPFSTIILQHYRGLPTQIPPDSTAFAMRREHILVEIIASWDPASDDDGGAHRHWARELSRSLAPLSLPGGYPALLGPHAHDQIAQAYGHNITRLQDLKHRFDPEGVFASTPLVIQTG